MGELNEKLTEMYQSSRYLVRLVQKVSNPSQSPFYRGERAFATIREESLAQILSLENNTVYSYREIADGLVPLLKNLDLLDKGGIVDFLICASFYDTYLLIEGDRNLINDIESGLDVGIRKSLSNDDTLQKSTSMSKIRALERNCLETLEYWDSVCVLQRSMDKIHPILDLSENSSRHKWTINDYADFRQLIRSAGHISALQSAELGEMDDERTGKCTIKGYLP